MQRAADDVDACASRLGLNVEAAVSDHLFLVAQVLSVLSTASSHFHYNVNVQKRRRLAWMEKQEAELDSSRELLCSGAALCDGDVSDLATLLESVSVIASLGKCELTPRMPAWLRGGSAFELGVDDFARVSDGVLSGCITGAPFGFSRSIMHYDMCSLSRCALCATYYARDCTFRPKLVPCGTVGVRALTQCYARYVYGRRWGCRAWTCRH